MKTMYREEAYGGSGVRDAVRVIQYELFELCNCDILETLRKGNLLTTTPPDTKALGYTKAHMTEFWMLSAKDKVEAAIAEYEENEAFVLDGSSDEELFCKELLLSIADITNINVKYALWLADKKSVQQFYGGTDETIDVYEVGPVVLSELGKDGTLFGYAEMPTPITTKKEKPSCDTCANKKSCHKDIGFMMNYCVADYKEEKK